MTFELAIFMKPDLVSHVVDISEAFHRTISHVQVRVGCSAHPLDDASAG